MRKIDFIEKNYCLFEHWSDEVKSWLLNRVRRLEGKINEVLNKGAVCNLCEENHETLLNILFEDTNELCIYHRAIHPPGVCNH